MAFLISNSWSSISLIHSSLQDQIYDFVANPVGPNLPFALPDPNYIVQLDYGPVHVDQANLAAGTLNQYGSSRFFDASKWQVRQWRNGKKVKTSAVTSAYGEEFSQVSSLDFTRCVSAMGLHYEGSNAIINSPGSSLAFGNLWGSAAITYIHQCILGPNKVEFRASHYPRTFFNVPPIPSQVFSDYTWPSPNHGVALDTDIHLYQTFLVFQQAVAIVKSMPTNTFVATNTTYVNKNATDLFSYDTGSSYGGDIKYQWVIEKSINNGPWQTAVAGGVDYTLVTGSLTGKGLVTFTFTGPPPATIPIRYRGTFQVVGYSTIVSGDPERTNPYINIPNNVTSKGNSGSNKDDWFFTTEIVGGSTAVQTVVTKTLPLVTPQVTPTTNPINTIVSILPILEAYRLVEVKCNVLIDARVAEKKTVQTVYTIVGNTSTISGGPFTTINIPSDPSITIASDPSKVIWLAEILSEHKIEVQVRSYGTNNVPVTIGAVQGVGPHTFLLPVGKYDVVVKLFAKPKQIIPSGVTLNLTTPPQQTQ